MGPSRRDRSDAPWSIEAGQTETGLETAVGNRSRDARLILYLDTSALVKLYVDEEHAAFTRRVASRAAARVTHDIAYVECCAALARRRRDGSLAVAAHGRCRRQLDRDWIRFSVVSVAVELIRRAAALADTQALRAYDSIHLAAAEATVALARGRTEFKLLAFDTRLLEAARATGIPTLLPN